MMVECCCSVNVFPATYYYGGNTSISIVACIFKADSTGGVLSVQSLSSRTGFILIRIVTGGIGPAAGVSVTVLKVPF
jgi:hypothetical protein